MLENAESKLRRKNLDIIVANEDGIVSVPKDKAQEVLKRAREIDERETKMVPMIKKERSLSKVIAIFKGTRHGIILGCEVTSGRLAVGERFRVIGAMGPIYQGRIESLHIEKTVVRAAIPPQRVGLLIHDFQRAGVGDLIESFRPGGPPASGWHPQAGVLHR